MTNPIGRPKIQLKDLPPTWKDDLIALGKVGGSDVEMMVKIGISKGLWYRLLEEEPEFLNTVKEAQMHCEAWWVAHGREMATGDGKGMPAVYIFNMKNRFKWRDRPEDEQQTITIPKLVIQTKED